MQTHNNMIKIIDAWNENLRLKEALVFVKTAAFVKILKIEMIIYTHLYHIQYHL